MVDASAAFRMNPLAALSIDRNALIGENLRPPGGIFYPGINSLSVEKPQEPGTSVPIGYNLLYKPDISLLEGQKPTNGFVGLYKNPPPGLQKPLVVPGDGLGLERRASDKPSDLGSSFLRLPWFTPYADASMYPFLDMAYKASFLSQPSPFLHQQLAYQSLCVAGVGGSTPGEERLFYLPPYAAAHISSPMGPPIGIPAATPAPAVLSPLAHCQEKALQGLGPQVHQEPSAFSSSPHIHQAVHHSERSQHTSTKNSASSSGSNSSSSGGSSTVPINSSASTAALESTTKPSSPSNTSDLQKSLYSTSSSSTSLSVSHPFYVGSASSERCNKTKDISSDRCNSEKCSSPAKTTVERAVPQMPAKKTGDKPLDLSAKELEGFPSKLEVLTKLGYLPPSRYGLLSSQEHHLKEGLSPPASMSAKIPDRPEIISTAHSPWALPGPSQIDPSKVSQVVKNKSVQSASVQQQSSSASSVHCPASGKRPPEASPSPQSKVERPTDSEKVLQSSKAEPRTCLVKQTPAKSDAQDNQPQTSGDNGNQSTQMYCDSYLPPGLGYTNRYVPYSVAESMSLQCMPMQGKGPVYPHPVLFGNGSFYPPRLAPKHGLPYGVHPNQGDYLAYQKSQEMAPTSVVSQPGLDTKDQLEDRSKCQDKPWNVERYKKILSVDCDNEQDNSTNQIVKVSGKSHPSTRDDVVCIDLVRDEADFTGDLPIKKNSTTIREDSSKHGASDINQIQGEQCIGPLNHTSEPLNQNSSPSGEEIPEETADEEEEQLSPLPDIPEEQTMRCARTSPHQFDRQNKADISPGLIEIGVSGGNYYIVGTNSGTEANVQNSASRSSEQDSSRNRSSPENRSDSDKTTGAKCGVTSPKSPANSDSDNPVCSGNRPDFQIPQNRTFNPRIPVGGVLNTRPSVCINTNLNSGDLNVIKRNFMGSHCRNLPVRSSAGEPFRTTVLMSQNCNRLNRNAVRLNCGNLQVLTCGRNNFSSFSVDQTFGNSPNCVDPRVSTVGGSIPTFQHLSIGNTTANFSNTQTDSLLEDDKNCDGHPCDDEMETVKMDSRNQVAANVLLDDDDGPGCSRIRRSGLAKRIANSSGYVGDRLKCVTTELYADASQLSREQRALQRAMLRFSELELKEKEGEGREEEEEEEEGEEELADGQRRDEGEGGEEEGEGEKKEAGGGRTPSAAAAEAPRGLHPSCPRSQLPIPPMCRQSDDDKNIEDVADGVFQDDMKSASLPDPQQRFVSAARGLFQGKVSMTRLGGMNPSVALNRRRIFSLEPFHQSSIISSKLKRSREDETEEEDQTDNHNKNKLNSDSTIEDVKKLKVCIELNGLRLNKPRLPGEIGHWLPSGQRSAELGRGRSEVSGGWCDPTFVRRDGALPSGPVFHVTPPSSPAHIPRQQCSSTPRHPSPASFSSLASSRLLDKHQRLRENRRVSGLLPSFPPLSPSSSSPPPLYDPHQFRCHGDDPDKPKGKRPCKMKHTGGGEEARGNEEEEDEEMVSSSDLPRPPLQSPAPSANRPAPPEVRRLIVNKNAGETLLQRAARLGYEEVVLYCLERRICDVNHRDNAGYCALHEACSRGWLSIVRHLVEHGADVNCSAQDGTRPLHDAVENDHVEVVRFLLACGADPTLTSYSGRGPINMTHSANMETFLEDYLSDLQGRADGDPGIYWEFHGSSVCERSNEGEVYNILADPPGPEEEEDDEHEDDDMEQRARREVFEFELSDRPLLPCYNIQVSLCQGPRNWLLLSDVLGRLRMTSKSFRRLFPQLNVQSIPEDEFYRQASLSQLLTGPDEQELASFRPDVKDPLELVEATPELAGMLGSSLEFVDSRWDSMEASPPATPPLPASPTPVIHIPMSLNSRTADLGAKVDKVLEDRSAASVQGPKNLGNSTAETAKLETKMNARTWESHPQGNKNIPSFANPSVILNANIWEPQKLRNKTTALNNFANPDSKLDSSAWEQEQHKNKSSSSIPDTTTGANMWEPQRLRSRNPVTTNTVTSDAKVDPEPQRLRSKVTGNLVNSNGKVNASIWKQQNHGGKNGVILGSTNDSNAVDGNVWEPQRLRSKNAAISCSSKTDCTADANIWERKGVKRQVGNSAATKREANSLETQTLGPKTFKLDASWPRNFGNVRVHIRDLGLSVGIGNIRKDVKKEQGKVVGKTSKIKTRS